MLFLIFFVICFLASVTGAVCGIGGGVIIKPVLDAFHIMDVSSISFLSGCTVLSMTAYSVLRSRIGGESGVDRKTGFPLAVGAALGGLAGKWMFSFVSSLSPDRNRDYLINNKIIILYFMTNCNPANSPQQRRKCSAACGIPPI